MCPPQNSWLEKVFGAHTPVRPTGTGCLGHEPTHFLRPWTRVMSAQRLWHGTGC